MNESVIYLPEVDSTNLWAKHNLDKFGPIGAVYTTHQTAGRGRLGRSWLDAPHKGLYYTAVIRTDLVQPATLPLFASLAVCDALRERYRIDCQIKWPNDLLLNGKKIVGILCEVGPDGHSIVVGIGINLAQPQEYFDAAGLPHGTSLALQGVPVDMDTDPEWLAQYMTDFGFEVISDEDFSENFTLEAGEKKPFQQISLTVHDEQAKLILAAIKYVYDHNAVTETFTNENHNGNGLYEVVREWAAMKQMRV